MSDLRNVDSSAPAAPFVLISRSPSPRQINFQAAHRSFGSRPDSWRYSHSALGAGPAVICLVCGSSAFAQSHTVTLCWTLAQQQSGITVASCGVDPTNPLDGVAAAQGTGTLSSSASVTTTNVNDFLVGANLVRQSIMARAVDMRAG